MDTMTKAYKPWKPMKIHKKIKLGRMCKKLTKITKLFKIFKPLFRMLSPAAAPLQVKGHDQADGSFMTLIIQVNPSKPGWQKVVSKLLKSCKVPRFKMDNSGVVQVSGIADAEKLLKKIGKSRKVELHWLQFGECSSYLFMPETKKNPPPVQVQPKSDNNNDNNIPYNAYYRNYHPYHHHHYQLPQLFKRYYNNIPYNSAYQPPQIPHYEDHHYDQRPFRNHQYYPYQPPQLPHYIPYHH